MLTDGEFVMPQSKVQQYGLDFMESIRSGNTLFAENDNKDEFVPRDKEKPFDVNLEAKQTEPETKLTVDFGSGEVIYQEDW